MMSNRRSTIGLLLSLSLAILPGRTAAQDATAVASGLSPNGSDHVLAGRIWDTSGRRFIDQVALLSVLQRSTLVPLDDNSDHHRLQARIVAAPMHRGRRPAVAFEMLSTDQERELAAYLRKNPDDAAGLGSAVGWKGTGRPDWEIYEPIAQAALDAGVPILAANLSPTMIDAIKARGLEAHGMARIAALRLDEPLPKEALDSMRRDLAASHCHMLSEAKIQAMMNILFARDAFMAETMTRGAGVAHRDGAVLIAGSGHTRMDRGVPWHLARLVPQSPTTSVAFVEVTDETRPDRYASAFAADVLPFDYVWFTPRAKRTDPCEQAAGESGSTDGRTDR